MVWRKFLSRIHRPGIDRNGRNTSRKFRKRRLQLERMERRELLASDVGAITGVAFIDEANDGFSPSDPPVLVDGSGDLVTPGTAGAQGIAVQLFEDTNNDNLFDVNDQLIGTDVTDLDGNYRFDGLTAGTYFLQQEDVPQLNTPSSVTVTVTNASGVRTALIDDYSETTQSVTATSNSTTSDSAAASESEVIGGSRDIEVTNSAATGQLTVFVDAVSDTLSVGSLGDAVGTALLQYDGADNTPTLDPDGLGGVSLSGGAATDPLDPGAGLVVMTRADSAGDDLTITVYTDAANSSTATIPIPQDDTNFVETFVRFSSFTTASGTGANFNDIGAIEASIGLSANNDTFVSIVESIRPEETIANISNILPVSLGGEVFLDTSTIGPNNGIREGTEAGRTGVTVDLYALAGPNDTVDPVNQTPVTSTTTGANGAYTFSGLTPGHYAVVIPASQFMTNASLDGFANSTGNDPAPDPDNDVDDDDNGTTLASSDVVSGTITLQSNDEPIDDEDTDANTNTTVDFGFFPQIDLAITKTLNAGGSSLVAGGNAVFDIVVQNVGPREATNVVVQDMFPNGLSFTGTQNASGSFITNVNGSTVQVEIGTMAAGAMASFQLTADIGSNQTDDLTNTATVSGTEVDIDPANDSDDAFLDLISSDLRITKTDVSDPVAAGSQITYEITVTNDGPDGAAGVVVTDPLPGGVTFASGDVEGNANLVSYDAGTNTVTATVGTLANGASAIATITVDVADDANSPLNNTATVTADPNTDPDASNNSADEETTVVREVDVEVIKSVTGTPIAGQDITYTIEVTNNGPGQARGVTVVDTLDPALTFVGGSFSAGSSGATFTQNGQVLTFDIGTMAGGASGTFSFDVSIDPSATGTIANAANGSTTDTDIDTTNDVGTSEIQVQQEVDLILAKDVDRATAVPGQDQLTYTFTVSHDTDSSSDASDVVITDVLPSGVTNAVISAPGATSSDVSNGTVTVAFATLPQGQTDTFTVTVGVVEDATGTIINPATVTTQSTDIDNTNDSDDATTTLTPAFDITVDKTVDNATPGPTEQVVYSVELMNTGPSTATGVVLSDAVPAGLTFVSGTLGGQSGTNNNGTISFPAVALAANETATATLTFTVDSDADGTITNTAVVPDLSANGETDATNNSDGADIVVIPLVDLAVTKTASSTAVQAGDNLTYTVMVDNNGPSLASNVQVTDALPAGVTFVSGTGPNGETLSATNGIVTVDGGDVANGGSFSFTITVQADAGTSGDITNSASVTSDTNETITTNNAATATVSVDPRTSSIRGTVFEDDDNDGVQDAGEEAIPGVEINLSGIDALGNAVNRSTTTDASGNYAFEELAAGTYTVTQTQPAGFRDGIESVGTGAPATAGDNVFSELVLGVGTDAAAFNFAELGEPLSKRRFLASTT